MEIKDLKHDDVIEFDFYDTEKSEGVFDKVADDMVFFRIAKINGMTIRNMSCSVHVIGHIQLTERRKQGIAVDVIIERLRAMKIRDLQQQIDEKIDELQSMIAETQTEDWTPQYERIINYNGDYDGDYEGDCD